jgi:peroxiredoxin Q/BCP
MQNTKAKNFTAKTIEGNDFELLNYSGNKILLSFYRNGACALCNLRVHELIQHAEEFNAQNIKLVGVFESSVKDMLPYVGKQNPPFVLLSDPKGIIYDLYNVESSMDKVTTVMKDNIANSRIQEAATKGFQLTPQEGANFFRLPADFLINENFEIQKSHYSNQIIDHLDVNEILGLKMKV